MIVVSGARDLFQGEVRVQLHASPAELPDDIVRFAWPQAYVKSKLTVKDLAQQASDAAAGYTGAARDAAMEVRHKPCAEHYPQVTM